LHRFFVRWRLPEISGCSKQFRLHFVARSLEGVTNGALGNMKMSRNLVLRETKFSDKAKDGPLGR